ncbi:MAG TPA: hypothetical protein VMU30_07805 [Bacteroidota bacterium]|nr:hypothetical protein [Bacteroidota bacterium]
MLTISIGAASVLAQQFPASDSTMVFTPSDPQLVRPHAYSPEKHVWGIDFDLSNNGFGMGFFFRHEYDEEFSGMINFTISDVKDNNEVEQYDWYGNSVVPGKLNRLLLMPLFASMQYRLFKDDIADNFRPYIAGGLGPTMILVAPYATYTPVVDISGNPYMQQNQIDFFTSMKYAQLRYTFGGFIGAGLFFGSPQGSMTGLSFRYLYVPYAHGIEVMQGGSMNTFGGLFLTITFAGFL